MHHNFACKMNVDYRQTLCLCCLGQLTPASDVFILKLSTAGMLWTKFWIYRNLPGSDAHIYMYM